MYNAQTEADRLATISYRSLEEYASFIRAALQKAYDAGTASASVALAKAQNELSQARTDLADFKRIWDVENIGERLETYTEGYRQRAEAVMDNQAKVIAYDRLQREVSLLSQANEDKAKDVRHWKERAEAAEAKLAAIITQLFPEALQQSIETYGLYPDETYNYPGEWVPVGSRDDDDVPF